MPHWNAETRRDEKAQIVITARKGNPLLKLKPRRSSIKIAVLIFEKYNVPIMVRFAI